MSAILEDGTILELAYQPNVNETVFVLGKGKGSIPWAPDQEWVYAPHVKTDSGRLVPYSPDNNLLKHKVVLLPSEAEEYGSEENLVANIQSFIHRYVELSPLFEKIASYYVLLSWVYDGFNELPYLKVRGEPGSGKTRFLTTVGSICYKPIFASGASTISPLFRILDNVQGTLIIDESDFRMSDEKAEAVKILNNGNMKGFPVLRSEVTHSKEFEPRAYSVFGPKIVATRGLFQDRALESRFLSEVMSHQRIREDIQHSFPDEYPDEALKLRNKLLLFRFRNYGKKKINQDLADRSLEPRLNQIFVPLLSVIEDSKAREDLKVLARSYNDQFLNEQSATIEAYILEIIREKQNSDENARLSVKEITDFLNVRHGEDFDRKLTARWIGSVIRRSLGLSTYKSHGTFVISNPESFKLERLYQRYGLNLARDQESDSNSINPPRGP